MEKTTIIHRIKYGAFGPDYVARVQKASNIGLILSIKPYGSGSIRDRSTIHGIELETGAVPEDLKFLTGCWIHTVDLKPWHGFTLNPLLPVLKVKFGESLVYTGQDEKKANKVFDILKEAKKTSNANEAVSLLITA